MHCPTSGAPCEQRVSLPVRDRISVIEPQGADGTDSDWPDSNWPNSRGDLVRDRTVQESFALLQTTLDSDEESAILTPSQVQSLARHRPAEWSEYFLGRIAEWSQPRYRLDGRFIGLSLLVDKGRGCRERPLASPRNPLRGSWRFTRERIGFRPWSSSAPREVASQRSFVISN